MAIFVGVSLSPITLDAVRRGQHCPYVKAFVMFVSSYSALTRMKEVMLYFSSKIISHIKSLA